MQERKTLGRREFTAASALAALSGVAITITSCGGSSSPAGSPTTPTNPPAPGPAPNGDVVGTVDANHGHSAVITAAQLTAAAAVTLDIGGTAPHTHSVTLSAEEVQQVADGARVSKQSTTADAHSHTVTFN